MSRVELDTLLIGNEQDWTFIGVRKWKQDMIGVIYPPVWSNPRFDPDPAGRPPHRPHELAREDYAFLTRRPLGETDVSVEFKCFYSAVVNGGIVLRAADSSRCYVLNMESRGRKGQHYDTRLWLQDATGLRKELARGTAPHSMLPEGPVSTRRDWYLRSVDWVTVRVQASTSFIRVSVDGRIIFDVRDRTYPLGCVGLVARGPVAFRNLTVKGEPVELPEPWSSHEGELPRFFYPGGEQPEGFNAYPVVCRTDDGHTLVAWSHGTDWFDNCVILTRSEDEGRTWSRPQRIIGREGCGCVSTAIFAHRDGVLSWVGTTMTARGEGERGEQTFLLRSSDGGASWSEPEEFLVAGHPLSPKAHLYSPWTRLSDGTVLMTGYESKVLTGADGATTSLDQSLLFRSADDGRTWDEPIYFDPDNFDHNECMVAEVEPGKLVAFMRTQRAPTMWRSESADGGRTWTPLVRSDVGGSCPYLLRHSCGVFVLISREAGVYVKLSFDQGRSWSAEYRISPASAMVGAVEMADGRILIAMHEGYGVPGYIRGQFFRVAPDMAGPVLE